MCSRRLFCLGLGILLCVFTGYQLAPYTHPSREFVAVSSAYSGIAAAVPKQVGRNEDEIEPNVAVIDIAAKRADDLQLRQSVLCTNNCNSSDIYRRLWLEARIAENSIIYQPSNDTDNPYQESIETNVVTKEFRVVLKVLAFNRLESLSRCLRSLAKADYGGDRVNIQIFIDHIRYDDAKGNETCKNVSVGETPFLESSELTSFLWRFFKRAHVHDAKVDLQGDTATARLVNISGLGQRRLADRTKDDMTMKTHEETERSGDEATPVAQNSTHDAPAAPRNSNSVKSGVVQLEEFHKILEFVDNFWWRHGTKEIHYRSQNVGLQTQWIESWWPTDLDEFAFIVEDDVEVSSLYYRFLRTVIATYYYNPEQYDSSVYGISLQRPRFVPGKRGFPLKFNSTKNLFRYPLVGTWGQLLFPKQWKEFRLWYDNHKSRGMKPVLEGMITNSWYKKLGERIWTPWFIKFAHSRGYFNLYTNFMNNLALSVSHREPGLNYNKSVGPDSQLIDKVEVGNDTMLWVMSPSKTLPQFDFCFRGMQSWSVATSLAELSPMLAAMEMNMSVLLVNTIGVNAVLVRNWLCHMERLGLRKFIILGDDNEFSRDLARRGYATVSAQVFSETETMVTPFRRDMVAVQAVYATLRLQYSVWLTRADTVWLENPFDNLGDIRERDIMGSQPLDSFHPALLYIRASQGLVHLWSKWVRSMSVLARELRSSSSRKHMSLWLDFQDFVTSNKNCHYLALPSSLSGSLKDIQMSKSNILASDKRLVLLSGLPAMGVVNMLKGAGLWAIDEDLACKRVHC